MAYKRKTKESSPKTSTFIATSRFKWFVIDKYIQADKGDELDLEEKYSEQLQQYLEKK